MAPQPLDNDRLVGRRVVVGGRGDIGSAVAHRMFTSGAEVVILDVARPTVTRRGMAFADALFDGSARLDGVTACRVDDAASLPSILRGREAIPVLVGDLSGLPGAIRPDVVVDARMRKRQRSESQRGRAPFTVGLGPGFVAGDTVDVAVETSWDALGEVVWRGPTRSFGGEPRPIGGHGRDRYRYSPTAGTFHTSSRIGDHVMAGVVIAAIDGAPLAAPLSGRLRGLCRNGVSVVPGTKVVEVDPRGEGAVVFGIGERPARIAEGVAAAVLAWDEQRLDR